MLIDYVYVCLSLCLTSPMIALYQLRVKYFFQKSFTWNIVSFQTLSCLLFSNPMFTFHTI